MIDVGNSLHIHASVNHAITYKLMGLASFVWIFRFSID